MSPDAASATATSSAAADNKQSLSKSQKKRMKQKASKAKKEAQQDREKGDQGLPVASALAGSNAGEKLNPHVKLRCDLVARGFTIDEVETALEEMWNLQMPYDEFDAALSYLQSKKAQQAADRGRPPSTSRSQPHSAPVVEEESTASTAASTTAALLHNSEDEEGFTASQNQTTRAFGAVEEEKDEGEPSTSTQDQGSAEEQPVEEEPAPASSGGGSRRKPKKQPMDLLSKLDMVANFENLGDAIFALTEWVTKAAKPREIAELCAAKKTRALPTVIRRSVADRLDQNYFISSVLPSVLDLIGGILSASGAPRSSIPSVGKSLASVIKQARASVETGGADVTAAETLATSVSEYVVTHMARAIEVAKYSSSSGEVETVRRIEEEIDALASSLAAGASVGGIVDLMTKRDTHRMAAEKSSMVVEITIVSSSSGEVGSSGIGSGAVASLDDGDQLASLIGSDAYKSVKTARVEFNNMKSKLEELQSDSSGQRQSLDSELAAYRSEKEVVTSRMEELRRELAVFEAQESEINEKINLAEAKISVLDENSSAEVKELKSQLTSRAKKLEFEDASRSVLDQLNTFETSLFKSMVAPTSSTAVGNGSSIALSEKLSNKMGIYLVRLRNYFKAEADCIDFLKGRAMSLEREIKDLEREIEECTALGMTTNVNQMTQSLRNTRQNISDDLSVVNALRVEAEKMRDELMKRLNEYHAASGSLTNSAFSSLHVSVLQGIMEAVSRIGMEDGGLSAYVAALGDNERNGMGQELLGLSNTLGQPEVFSEAGGEEAEPRGYLGELMNGDGTAAVIEAAAPAAPLDSGEGVAVSAADGSSPMPTPVAPPPEPVLPKLSWATGGVGVKKAEVKSLLDIQKEELSAKE